MNKLLSAALLASLSFVVACGGEDEPPPRTFSCTATVSPASFGYRMLGRDLLEVSDNVGTATYSRIGSGSDVYGVWHVGTDVNGSFVSTLDIRIQPGFLSALADCDFGTVSADAVATAPAEIGIDTITVLGSDSDTQTVTDR